MRLWLLGAVLGAFPAAAQLSYEDPWDTSFKPSQGSLPLAWLDASLPLSGRAIRVESPAEEIYEILDESMLLSCRHLDLKVKRIEEWRHFLSENLERQTKTDSEKDLLASKKSLFDGIWSNYSKKFASAVALAKLRWELPPSWRDENWNQVLVIVAHSAFIEIGAAYFLPLSNEGERNVEFSENRVELQTLLSLPEICGHGGLQIQLIRNCTAPTYDDLADCDGNDRLILQSSSDKFPWPKIEKRRSRRVDLGGDE